MQGPLRNSRHKKRRGKRARGQKDKRTKVAFERETLAGLQSVVERNKSSRTIMHTPYGVQTGPALQYRTSFRFKAGEDLATKDLETEPGNEHGGVFFAPPYFPAADKILCILGYYLTTTP